MPRTSAAPIADERITQFGLLIEAHARLTRLLGADLERNCGIPLHWYEVLLRLGRSSQGRMKMSELAAQISLTSSGITRLIDRLEAEALVAREQGAHDRRVVYAVLTTNGRRRLNQATKQHLTGLQRHFIDPLESDQLAALTEALDILRHDPSDPGRPSSG